jgi:hypothetical protein
MSIFNIVVYEDVLASDNTLRTLNEKVTALQSRLNERERVIEDGIATYNDHDRDNCALNTLLVRLQLLEAQRDRYAYQYIQTIVLSCLTIVLYSDRHRAALWCRPIFRIEPAFTSLGVVGLQLLVRYLSAVTEETRAQLRGVESRMEYLRDFTLDLSESDANLEEYGKAVLDTQALLLTLGNLRIFYEALMAVAEDMWYVCHTLTT